MLLALDINSNRTGFAFGGPSDGAPRAGCWRVPGAEDLPRACGALSNSIKELAALIKPKFVVIEAPLQIQGGGSNARVALVLISLYGAAIGASHTAGAFTIDGHVGTWRKHFIGVGNLKSDEAKRATIERCRLLGWPAQNHDEADACGLWSWGMATNYRQWAPQSTPLFGRPAA